MSIKNVIVIGIILSAAIAGLVIINQRKKISEEKRDEIVQKYNLDVPSGDEMKGTKVNIGVSEDAKEVTLFKEGEKEVIISGDEEIQEFLLILNTEAWTGIQKWNKKSQPSKYFLLGDGILLGIIEDDSTCYIKLEGAQIEELDAPYRYYEVPKSLVEFFDKYYR